MKLPEHVILSLHNCCDLVRHFVIHLFVSIENIVKDSEENIRMTDVISVTLFSFEISFCTFSCTQLMLLL